MIKGSLVLTFLLLNSLSAQEYLGAEDIPSRHELEMQFLKEAFTPVETPVVSEALATEEDIADEVATQAAAPLPAPTTKPAEDDEDFVLPLEQEMFGVKEEKPSRTKKAAKNSESNHKRRLR